jgi:membrane-associated phospholipid phosphatase
MMASSDGRWAPFVVRCVCFVVVTATLVVVCIDTVDETIARRFVKPLPSGQMQAGIDAMRAWGEGSVIVLLTIGLVLARAVSARRGLAVLAVCLAAGASAALMKPLFDRMRPSEVHASMASGAWHHSSGANTSFPSGHTATAFALARSLSVLFPAVAPVCLLGATGTAASRMLDERHYLSDCVAGAALGWICAGFAWGPRRRRRQDGGPPINAMQEEFLRVA